MRTIITLFSLTSLILFSCQKEVDYAERTTNVGSGNNTSGTRLVKLVSKTSGTDSSVNVYTYNSSGKLIGIVTTGNDAGTPIDTRKTFVRNSQGIIQKVILKDAELVQYGLDSIVSNVHYDAATAHYTSWALVIDVLGTVIRDSVVFIYNTNGKVITESAYSDNGGGTYLPSAKFDYTYSGNNIISKKSSSYNGGTYSEDFTIADEYDTKVSPLILGNEAFVIDPNSLAPYYSSNNLLKETITYPADPTETIAIAYTYNTSDRPSSAIFNFQPDNTAAQITYYYQ
jgi:hypothetical protein